MPITERRRTYKGESDATLELRYRAVLSISGGGYVLVPGHGLFPTSERLALYGYLTVDKGRLLVLGLTTIMVQVTET